MIVVKRLRMEGFIVMDFADQDTRALADLTAWVQSGQIRVVEDIVDTHQEEEETTLPKIRRKKNTSSDCSIKMETSLNHSKTFTSKSRW